MKRRLLVIVIVSCSGGGGVSSTQDAETAYLGLDESIGKAIDLGFAGYNATTNANIPTETADGDVSGSMAINGTVDHGASTNRVMMLTESLTHYADLDGGAAAGIVYDTTDGGPAALSMNMMNVPTGTLGGTLNGTFSMSGKLQGNVTLAVSFNGQLQPGPDGGGVERKPGSTMITGTATSGSNTYQIMITH